MLMCARMCVCFCSSVCQHVTMNICINMSPAYAAPLAALQSGWQAIGSTQTLCFVYRRPPLSVLQCLCVCGFTKYSTF